MSSKPQRKQSWSFSLTGADCYSSSSQEDSQAPPPRRAAAEQESLIAEAEQEGVPEYPPPELYDIAQIEEGDVRYRETPFTIARRVAAPRKRIRDDDEETDELQTAASSTQPASKRQKSSAVQKYDSPEMTRPAAQRRAGHQTSSSSPNPKLSSKSTPTRASKPSELAQKLSSGVEPTAAPHTAALPASKCWKPSAAAKLTPYRAPPQGARSSTHISGKSKLRPPLPPRDDSSTYGEASGQGVDGEGSSAVLSSEGSLWDHHEHSSSVGTLPSSPTAPPSFAQRQSHFRRSKQQPQIRHEIDRRTFTSSPRASSASSSAPIAQSTEELQLADASQPSSSHLSASFRPTQTFSSSRHSQSTPSRLARPLDSKVNTPSPRQRSGATRPNTRPLRDLEDPPSPPRSRPQTSPHRPTPGPTSSSSSTTTWSTLTSRSRPSIIPKPSAYGSGLEGISATSAANTRFALPEFAPQGGDMPMVVRERAAAAAVGQQQQMQQSGTPRASRMAFKPTESLGAFKARVAREKAEVEARGGGQVEREEGERLLFGANVRSVKAGTVVSVGVGKGDDEGQKEGGGSLYRDFSW